MSIFGVVLHFQLARSAVAPASHTSTTGARTFPRLDRVFLVCSRTSPSRSQRDTDAPDSSNRAAMASPMPCAASGHDRHVFPSGQFGSPVLLLKFHRGVYFGALQINALQLIEEENCLLCCLSTALSTEARDLKRTRSENENPVVLEFAMAPRTSNSSALRRKFTPYCQHSSSAPAEAFPSLFLSR